MNLLIVDEIRGRPATNWSTILFSHLLSMNIKMNKYIYVCVCVCACVCVCLYSVSQEECNKLRESVPYVKLHQYNPKHLYPKLNGYGDNGQRKVWFSGGSTHCTCHCTSLIEALSLCMVLNYGNSTHDSPELHMTSLQLDNSVQVAAGL